MSRRKKHKRIIGNVPIISISVIIALSTMGVGYATWNSKLNIKTTVTTGYTQGRIKEIKDSDLNLDDGEWISFRFSDDNQTLYIDGEVYPTFNGNIPLKIIDEGSIPIVFKNIDLVTDTDITELKEATRGKYSDTSYLDEDIVESFQIDINSKKDTDNNDSIMRRDTSEQQDEISNLEDFINNYNTESNYEFQYKPLFEQSL